MDLYLYKELKKEAKKNYFKEKSGHDFSHIRRCLKYANKILKRDGGDEFIVKTAILFHDMHRVMQSKQGKFVHPAESIENVRNILGKYNINDDNLNEILFIIANHESKEMESDNLNFNIVRDSDILDALGKRGLIRTRKYCYENLIPVYDSDFSLNTKVYIPDINPISCVHYVYRTMIGNAEYINTKTAKILAINKLKPLKKFVNKYSKIRVFEKNNNRCE